MGQVKRAHIGYVVDTTPVAIGEVIRDRAVGNIHRPIGIVAQASTVHGTVANNRAVANI